MRHWLNGKQNSLCLCSYAVFMVIRRVHPALLPLFPPSSCSLPLIHHSQLSWMLFFHRVLLSSLPFLSVRYTFALTTLYHSAIISQTSPHHRPSPPSVYPSPSHHPPIHPYRSTPHTTPCLVPLPLLVGNYHAGFYKIYVCRRAPDGGLLFIFPVTVIFQTHTDRRINVPGCF